ncbi:MAG: AMP-binding protein [Betaproteobacteria bacterium]
MSTYTDRFVAERLPPRSEWPVMLYPQDSLHGDSPLNLVSLLLDQAMDKPWADRPLFRSADQTLSYREALSAVNQRVHLLRSQAGVQTGNRVLLRGHNSIDFALAWLAVVKAGLIAVPTMPLLRAKELGDIIAKARPSIAWCEASLSAELLLAQEQHPDLHTVLLFHSHSAADSVESLSAGFSTAAAAYPATGDDIALLAFTSGTTGVPKAVCHSHLDVWSACQAWPLQVLRAHMQDIVTGTPPLAFTFGLGGLLLFPMVAGASIFYPSPPLTPERMVQEMALSQATICYTAPTFYRQMAAHIQQHPVPALRICISAGEALPDATRQLWREACGLEMLDGIGATEMFHIFISSPLTDVKPGSLGKAVPGYEAKVLDPQGQELPRGHIGRLAVRGATGCKYLDDDRQRAYVQSGWNFPGDAVLQDEDGYFFYQSRADDMIVSSGYNIGGPEVEDALLLHPSVVECAVIGKADAERGMVVQAFCVLHADAQASAELVKRLQDHVKQHLAPYKYPRVITFLPSLPRTATGKLQRFKLRDLNN